MPELAVTHNPVLEGRIWPLNLGTSNWHIFFFCELLNNNQTKFFYFLFFIFEGLKNVVEFSSHIYVIIIIFFL